MCLALIAFRSHPRHRVVVAANRDEQHARPAAPAAWWDEGFVAGRDLKAGGTWLGLTRGGRFALLTNVRDPARHDPTAPSRGSLVPDILEAAAPPSVALPIEVRAGARHNGFNLIAGDLNELVWGSNRADAPRLLGPGIYGISNHLLDTPWPKVTRTKAAFQRWCEKDNGSDDFDELFTLMHDTTTAAADALPATGLTMERERMLSSPFITSADYGTRCTTIVTIDSASAVLIERRFDAGGEITGEVEHRFALLPTT